MAVRHRRRRNRGGKNSSDGHSSPPSADGRRCRLRSRRSPHEPTSRQRPCSGPRRRRRRRPRSGSGRRSVPRRRWRSRTSCRSRGSLPCQVAASKTVSGRSCIANGCRYRDHETPDLDPRACRGTRAAVALPVAGCGGAAETTTATTRVRANTAGSQLEGIVAGHRRPIVRLADAVRHADASDPATLVRVRATARLVSERVEQSEPEINRLIALPARRRASSGGARGARRCPRAGLRAECAAATGGEDPDVGRGGRSKRGRAGAATHAPFCARRHAPRRAARRGSS